MCPGFRAETDDSFKRNLSTVEERATTKLSVPARILRIQKPQIRETVPGSCHGEDIFCILETNYDVEHR